MTDPSSTCTSSVPITLKWGKKTFPFTIQSGESGSSFKQRVQAETGVPITRQKLLLANSKSNSNHKKSLIVTPALLRWKGPLKDDAILNTANAGDNENLNASLEKQSTTVVTLIGSAETLVEPTIKIKFIEDLTPEDLRRQEDVEMQAAIAGTTGMIQALQCLPHKRDDQKQEFYQYNRLVAGLPQRQIEQMLKCRQTPQRQDDDIEMDINGPSASQELQGKVAMNFGLELRRGYVNDLAVLDDGTCVSVLDDGHVQLWKHAAEQGDVVQPGPADEIGVNSVVTLHGGSGAGTAAFATAGRGRVQLWTNNSSDQQPMMAKALQGAMPGTTPASLTAVLDNVGINDNKVTCLAARFQITRPPTDPQQFRLPPQNEAQRQRRAHAQAQEQAMQRALAKASRSIQVWCLVFSDDDPTSATNNGNENWRSQILEAPHHGNDADADLSPPISCLTSMTLMDGITLLIAGDVEGGLRIWKVQTEHDGLDSVSFSHHGLYQLPGSSIVCMKVLQNNRLAVSTNSSNQQQQQQEQQSSSFHELLPGAIPIPIPDQRTRAVHIIDFSGVGVGDGHAIIPTLHTSLTGHEKDAVICMCQLPNGDLLTGGGKMDATLQLWSKSQIEDEEAAAGGQVAPHNNANVGTGPNDAGADIVALSVPKVISKAHKILTEVGYVFSIAVLPDAKKESNNYAVAVARYNTVKIIL